MRLDVVIDTDAFNEIDDQYAIAYLLRSDEDLNLKEIYAAPFFNKHSNSPEDGMEKSYDEIMKVLKLADREDLVEHVYKGSTQFLENEDTPVVSEAAQQLIMTAEEYTRENPLYVVAIGAITNVASALIMKPEIAEKIVVVWLGGHSYDYRNTAEFNMKQDIAAARVVFQSGTALVQVPCYGVVNSLVTTQWELEHWLKGKNKLCDYLVENTIREAESYAAGKPWSRVIWDVVPVAWLMNEKERFMLVRDQNVVLPEYTSLYSKEKLSLPMKYVYYIKRDAILEDLFKKLTKQPK